MTDISPTDSRSLAPRRNSSSSVSSSSSILSDDGAAPASKRRRSAQACDVCRKKKIRCCYNDTTIDRCAYCTHMNRPCTFASRDSKRTRVTAAYVAELESRVRGAEAALLTQQQASQRTPQPQRRGGSSSSQDDEDDEAGDDYTFVAVPSLSPMQQHHHPSTMTIEKAPKQEREQQQQQQQLPLYFFGGASDVELTPRIQFLLNIKVSDPVTSDTTTVAPVISAAVALAPSSDTFNWPSPATQAKLIDVYFDSFNRHYPLLNEVLFRQKLANSAASHNDWKNMDVEHAMLALAVFSTGTRFLLNEVDDEEDVVPLRQQGIYWAALLHSMLEHRHTPVNATPTYLQVTMLCVFCLIATHDKAQAGWLLLGRVVRLLQNIGAHRRFTARNNGFSLATDELYRRLWWAAFLVDRMMSAHFGRPMCIHEDDVDVGEMRLVDDDVLVHGAEAGGGGIDIVEQQRTDAACRYSGFFYSVRLGKIVGRALRSLYSSRQRPSATALDTLDEALQRWLQQLPSHLCYDDQMRASPSSVDDVSWLADSARLRLVYHYVCTLVHRPFIRPPNSAAVTRGVATSTHLSQTLRSLQIVSDASQAGIEIVHDLCRRHRRAALMLGAEVHLRTLTFSIFLLSISIGTAAAGSSQSSSRVHGTVVAQVEKAVYSLQSVQRQWPVAAEHVAQLQQIIHSIKATPSSLRRRTSSNSDVGRHENKQPLFSYQHSSTPAPPPPANHSSSGASSWLTASDDYSTMFTFDTPTQPPSIVTVATTFAEQQQQLPAHPHSFTPLDVLTAFDDYFNVTDWNALLQPPPPPPSAE